MDRTYWHKQTADQPLFPDLLWSRPENRAQAGKLGIIGGNLHGFAAAAETYTFASDAGVGTARVLLPDSLRSTVGKVFEAGEYAPSTPSGSFSQKALAEFLELAQWADGILLAGDFGQNSETAIVLGSFLNKFSGRVTLTGDTMNYFLNQPGELLSRSESLLVLDLPQLQRLAAGAKFPQAFTSTMDLLRLVEVLHDFTSALRPSIIVIHQDTVYIAVNGQISTTKSILRANQIAAYASVFWLQNPNKAFEALSSSIAKY